MSAALMGNIVGLHAAALAILALILLNLRHWVDVDATLRRMMAALALTTAGAIVCDLLSWGLDGRPGETARWFNQLFTSMDFLLVSLPAILWYLMSVYLTCNRRVMTRRRGAMLGVTLAALALMTAVNPLTGMLFRIDGQNRYLRGAGFYILFAVAAFYMVMATRQAFLHRNDHTLDSLWAQIFWLPPVAAGVLQQMLPGVSLLYMGMTLSVLMLFIGLQTKSIRLDYLTGVHNRRYLDQYFGERMRQGPFSAVLLDIDDFKQINDEYGHMVGDDILVVVASMLKVSARNRDFVARYGGDEFMIVVDSDGVDALYAVISRINYQIFQFNNSGEYPFNISVSMGYDVFDPSLYPSKREFLTHIDRLLYSSKGKKPFRLEMKHRVGPGVGETSPGKAAGGSAAGGSAAGGSATGGSASAPPGGN